MRKPFLAAALAASLAAGLGGCVSLLPKTKPAQLYRFGAGASASPATGEGVSGAGKTGVVLATIDFPRASTSDGILTVTGDETAYIAGARWVAPARLLFQEAVQRAFERHAVRSQLVNVGDVGPASAILRIDVTSFETRYGNGAPSIVVSLTARLTRSDGRLLDQREFTEAEHAGADSISSIVTAFDHVTDKVLTDVTAWTDAEVTSAASSPSPPPASVTTSSSTTSTTTTVEHP